MGGVEAVLAVIALSAGQHILFGVAALGTIATVVAVMVTLLSTAPAVSDFNALKARCEQAHSRLYADALDPEYRTALNAMIACPEGTLAYCAAGIAAEIRCHAAARPATVALPAIDPWDELEAIGTSAREITEEREDTEHEIGDIRLREGAIALLAARVSAFADYRDRLHLFGTAIWRDNRIVRRAVTPTSDELAADGQR